MYYIKLEYNILISLTFVPIWKLTVKCHKRYDMFSTTTAQVCFLNARGIPPKYYHLTLDSVHKYLATNNSLTPNNREKTSSAIEIPYMFYLNVSHRILWTNYCFWLYKCISNPVISYLYQKCMETICMIMSFFFYFQIIWDTAMSMVKRYLSKPKKGPLGLPYSFPVVHI